MGYTHYFSIENKISKNVQNEVHVLIQHVLNEYSEIIQYESDNTNAPINTGGVIRFNGIGELGHETFYIDLNKTGFNFCKTARKPYDLPACVVLLICKKVLGDSLDLSSDGYFNEDWNESIEWFNDNMSDIIGYNVIADNSGELTYIENICHPNAIDADGLCLQCGSTGNL